ncbi:MAG: LPS export ABC transporter permease LptG [Rhodothalassiaceae bacterium]
MSFLRPIRRYFIPSRTLGRYMGRLFLVRFAGIAIGVAIVLQMLDLLAQSDDILAGAGNDGGALWQYVGLRLPDLMSRFIPFSALLATLITLAQLSQHSEITIMKGAGLSAHRILLPLTLVSVGIAVAHFLFAEFVVTPSNARLDYWKRFDYAADLPPPPDIVDEVWLTEGRSIILVNAVNRSGSRVILDRVTIYVRNEDNLLEAILRADFAWHNDGAWTLYSVRRFDVMTHEIETMDSMPWNIRTAPERFFTASIDTEGQTVAGLRAAIAQLEREGQATDAPRTMLYQKFAEPMGTILMPTLGAIAGFGLARRGKLLARVAAGMGLGFAYFVADNFMLAMGKFGAAPPFLAAFGPLILFACLGLALIFRTEE